MSIKEKIKYWLPGVCILLLIGTTAMAANDSFDIVLRVTTSMTATIQWLAPEGRVGADQTNWDTQFYLTVKASDDNDDTVYYTGSDLATTTEAGIRTEPIALGDIAAGPYDVYVKAHQHLTRKLDDVSLTGGDNTLNFTQADNSGSLGEVRLLAGDINGSTSSPGTLGDDVVNSVDLGIIIDNLDGDDPTGNDVRANLNQDTVVNSVDLSLLIKNLDLEGDE